MTVNSRLGIFLAVCILGLYLILEARTQDRVDHPSRPDAELCAEITVELQRSAQQGLISPSEAQTVSERCYSLL